MEDHVSRDVTFESEALSRVSSGLVAYLDTLCSTVVSRKVRNGYR